MGFAKVCAFCVNQHAGICAGNPYNSKDPVTGELYPLCNCGAPKYFNDIAPLRPDGKGIDCEMNKFDDMVAYLAFSVPGFMQVIAVDQEFQLFTRAWCVAEISKASQIGMPQRVKFQNEDAVDKRKGSLKKLRVQEMKASRPEDVAEILQSIPDHDQYNSDLQHIIFDKLFADWQSLDAAQQIEHAGRIVRWQSVATSRRSEGVWLAASI